HIVYFGEHKGDKALDEIEDIHHSYLLSVKKNEEDARASLLYSYKHSINGFAAMLTLDEASKLSDLEEVVSVYKSYPRKYSLQTTRSWGFVGMDAEYNDYLDMGKDILKKAKYGKEVIVGVLDSGVWPESKSFSDEGMEPIPKSWGGSCEAGLGFNSSHCNKKLIGARYYIKGFEHYFGALNSTEDDRSPRDMDGHGTHTASTAVGRRVAHATAFGGYGGGTASGGAPLARLAIYKACWAMPNVSKIEGNICFDEDMLAGIDDAIRDGVDILSISIGTAKPVPYTEDSIAIGALHALKKNIVVACAAGNSGPAPSTLSNPAPWIITVGASSVDRMFYGPLVLGNGMKINGQSVTPYNMDKMHPLVYAADVTVPDVPMNLSENCSPGSLDPEMVKGKVVLCIRGTTIRVEMGQEVKRAGGFGMILGNNPSNWNEMPVDPHYLPATAVIYDDTEKILNYIKSTKNPTARIQRARTVLNYKPAPCMTNFTSRGPNVVDPNILKPDVTAPGMNILAAWSGGSSPTKLPNDHRVVKFNFDSGTSMATPHVAAAAALLKAIHPNWRSAAIRSALMTTAGVRNNMGEPLTDSSGNIATPFQYGSGHFRPVKATDPGLIYDASYKDYLLYLCSVNVTNVDPTFKCPQKPPPAVNLNYPSIAISKFNGSVTVPRTVTNVGISSSVYFFSAKPPVGLHVQASPSILFFDHVGQKKSFTITVTGDGNAARLINGDYAFGWYDWSDGPYHLIRSPISISLA
ncbi:Peptidase_S8 domain-containing protein/PA domain-containing protein/Inhibitor_I9 domain-containing protein, partial [Cephalotus follicularis]